jgi:UDP-N-acetylglucosamine/UDP-N-acetylgalactosamine diphosphorylase
MNNKIPENISTYLKTLETIKRDKLIKQIESLNPQDLEEQKKSFLHIPEIVQKSWPALTKCSSLREGDLQKGKKAYKEGKVAFVLLAGGQGVRLGSDKPKGCFPVTLIKHKSLFQVFCEKIFYAQKYYNQEFEIIIWVSCSNGKETEKFFIDHQFFGLKSDNVHFVYQTSLPVLDQKGIWQLAKEDELYLAPNGNGQVFYHLEKNGYLNRWEQKGIETVILFSIDNPLTNPFSEEMLGLHLREKNDVTLQVIPYEKNCGALVSSDKKIAVLEYLYLNENNQYFFCNTNFFCFSLPYTKRMAKNDQQIGYHLALKKAEIFENNTFVDKEIFKSEKFLFDHFIHAKRVGCLLFSKDKCFAPLKRIEDLHHIQEIFLKQDEEMFYKVFKKMPSKKPFELSLEFYYLTPQQIKLCQKNFIPNLDYFEPLLLE